MKSRSEFRWALIEPTRFAWDDPEGDVHFFADTPMPRGVTTLAGQLLAAGYTNGRVFCEAMGPIDWDWVHSCDAVGLGVITCTAPRAYQIADELEARGIPVVLGGQEPTYKTELALQHGRAVVRGEGDFVLTAILDHWRAGQSLVGIPGVVYRDGERTVENPRHPWVSNLDRLPYASFDSRVLAHAEKLTFLPVHAIRGCNRGCQFCSECRFWGPPRAHSPGYVIREIEANLRPWHQMVFLTANNIGIEVEGNLNWLDEFADRLIASGNKMPIVCQAEADLALKRVDGKIVNEPNDALLSKLYRAGFRIVCIGFENPISQEALDQMGKGQQVARYATVCRAFRRHGLRIHAMTIAGMKGDSPETAPLIARTMVKWHVFSMQLSLLTYMAGSAIYNRVRDGKVKLIGPHDDPVKDTMFDNGLYARFHPEGMSGYELQQSFLEAMKVFYSRWEMWKSLLPNPEQVRTFFKELHFQGVFRPRGWKRAIAMAYSDGYTRIRARRLIRLFEKSPSTRQFVEMLRVLGQKPYEGA